MRKLGAFVSLALVVTAAASAPVSSQSPSAAPSTPGAAACEPTEPTTLVVMHNWPKGDGGIGDVMQAFLAEVTAAHPNITIQQEVFQDGEINTKVETGFIAGQEPDVVFQNMFTQNATWADKGITVPVDQFITDWGFEGKFKDLALADYTPYGTTLAFPLQGFTWPVWYNTDILAKAGVEIPTTVEELIAAAPKIRAAGYQPFAMAGGDWPGQTWLQNQSLAYMTDDEAEQLWLNGGWADNPAVKAWVDDFVAMRDADVFADGYEGMTNDQMQQLYFDGKAAMVELGSWAYPAAPEAIANVTTLGGIPMGAQSARTRPTSTQAYTGKGVWITRNGATKLDAVCAFVQQLYSPEVQEMMIEQAAMVSALKDVPVDADQLGTLFKQSLTLGDTTDLTEVMDMWLKTGIDPSVFKAAFLKSSSADTIIQSLVDAWNN